MVRELSHLGILPSTQHPSPPPRTDRKTWLNILLFIDQCVLDQDAFVLFDLLVNSDSIQIQRPFVLNLIVEFWPLSLVCAPVSVWLGFFGLEDLDVVGRLLIGTVYAGIQFWSQSSSYSRQVLIGFVDGRCVSVLRWGASCVALVVGLQVPGVFWARSRRPSEGILLSLNDLTINYFDQFRKTQFSLAEVEPVFAKRLKDVTIIVLPHASDQPKVLARKLLNRIDLACIREAHL